MTVGERIKSVREKSGYSQTELAKLIGTTKQTLYKYENNIVTNIPSDKIEKIACALNVSESYLMGWEKNLTKENSELIVDCLRDGVLVSNIEKLRKLNKEHQQTIYDMIAYWYEKEGHH